MHLIMRWLIHVINIQKLQRGELKVHQMLSLYSLIISIFQTLARTSVIYVVFFDFNLLISLETLLTLTPQKLKSSPFLAFLNDT